MYVPVPLVFQTSLIPARHSLSAFRSGTAALLNHLFYLLGEQGDACLIPAPYYAAFEKDMNLYAGIVPIGIDQDNPVSGPTEEELERTHRAAVTVRFFVVCMDQLDLGVVKIVLLMTAVICVTFATTARSETQVHLGNQSHQSTWIDLQSQRCTAHCSVGTIQRDAYHYG